MASIPEIFQQAWTMKVSEYEITNERTNRTNEDDEGRIRSKRTRSRRSFKPDAELLVAFGSWS